MVTTMMRTRTPRTLPTPQMLSRTASNALLRPVHLVSPRILKLSIYVRRSSTRSFKIGATHPASPRVAERENWSQPVPIAHDPPEFSVRVVNLPLSCPATLRLAEVTTLQFSLHGAAA